MTWWSFQNSRGSVDCSLEPLHFGSRAKSRGWVLTVNIYDELALPPSFLPPLSWSSTVELRYWLVSFRNYSLIHLNLKSRATSVVGKLYCLFLLCMLIFKTQLLWFYYNCRLRLKKPVVLFTVNAIPYECYLVLTLICLWIHIGRINTLRVKHGPS